MKKSVFIFSIVSFGLVFSQKEKLAITKNIENIPNFSLPKSDVNPQDSLNIIHQQRIKDVSDSLKLDFTIKNQIYIPNYNLDNPNFYTSLMQKQTGNTIPIPNAQPLEINILRDFTPLQYSLKKRK